MWLNPEAYDVQSDTWQTVQGKIAVGSGGLFGRGLGKSLQKHLFVSQPQNDFIYSIVCEELGFIGGVGVIVLYFVFIFRGLHIAKNSRDVFSALTVIGIVGHVGTQALLNIGVVTGLLPNTGITLPFFSAGGSSLIILLAEMGIILTISRRARIDR
jgi:cell division protein FtsW